MAAGGGASGEHRDRRARREERKKGNTALIDGTRDVRTSESDLIDRKFFQGRIDQVVEIDANSEVAMGLRAAVLGCYERGPFWTGVKKDSLHHSSVWAVYIYNWVWARVIGVN